MTRLMCLCDRVRSVLSEKEAQLAAASAHNKKRYLQLLLKQTPDSEAPIDTDRLAHATRQLSGFVAACRHSTSEQRASQDGAAAPSVAAASPSVDSSTHGGPYTLTMLVPAVTAPEAADHVVLGGVLVRPQSVTLITAPPKPPLVRVNVAAAVTAAAVVAPKPQPAPQQQPGTVTRFCKAVAHYSRETVKFVKENPGAVASVVLDCIPIVGNIKSGVELISGKDLITGEPVPRWVSAASLVVPGGQTRRQDSQGRHRGEVRFQRAGESRQCGCQGRVQSRQGRACGR